jgi:mannosylglycerate hydrolase
MAMLDSLGIPYEENLVYKAWETLVLCQTHSSANLTNETNEFIKVQTNNALNLANSMVAYLNKLLSISLEDFDSEFTPLLVSNTLPYAKDLTFETKVFTKEKTFSLYTQDNQKIDYTILKTVKKNNGVLRKDTLKINEDKFYYVHDVICHLNDFQAMSYEVIKVVENSQESQVFASVSYDRFIENEFYKLYQDEDGITLLDKTRNKQIKQVIYLEDGGDEGDSFDYSYPNQDLILTDSFSDAQVDYIDNTYRQTMTLSGTFEIPQNLSERKNKRLGALLDYEIKLILDKGDNMIKIEGSINNEAIQHRVRLVFKGDDVYKEHSYSGTQFDYIKRETNPEALQYWKEDGWFEEPSPNWPLLNHVSSVGNVSLNVYTRSSKEYELIGEQFSDIAVVLFRSYGALGYPDLNRRPGRPGGLDYMVFETSDSQMIGKNSFELAFNYTNQFDGNAIRNMYINYAADPIVHHQQNFDKSINAIQYFPTNPLETKLPLKHQFISLANFEGSYGTLLKEKDYYVLRVYNNQDKEIPLNINLPKIGSWEISEIDLLGNKVSENTETLKANELKIIKIKEV